MQNQKRTFVILICLVLALLGTMAAKTNSMGISEKQTISFSEPTIVAGTLLPTGDYKVTHEMEGQNHVMIFKQVNGKAEAKAKCTLVPLATTATQSEQHYNQNAKNQRVLIEMTFYGDKASHVLAP